MKSLFTCLIVATVAFLACSSELDKSATDAVALADEGKFEEALAELDRLKEVLGEDSPRLAYNRGLVLEKQDDLENAIDQFSLALRGDHETKRLALYSLGSTYSRRALKYQEAEDFKQAMELYQSAIGSYQDLIRLEDSLIEEGVIRESDRNPDAQHNLEITKLWLKNLIESMRQKEQQNSELQKQLEEIVRDLKRNIAVQAVTSYSAKVQTVPPADPNALDAPQLPDFNQLSATLTELLKDDKDFPAPLVPPDQQSLATLQTENIPPTEDVKQRLASLIRMMESGFDAYMQQVEEQRQSGVNVEPEKLQEEQAKFQEQMTKFGQSVDHLNNASAFESSAAASFTAADLVGGSPAADSALQELLLALQQLMEEQQNQQQQQQQENQEQQEQQEGDQQEQQSQPQGEKEDDQEEQEAQSGQEQQEEEQSQEQQQEQGSEGEISPEEAQQMMERYAQETERTRDMDEQPQGQAGAPHVSRDW